ncbi:bifunctional UDP-sugar hydrolase/5'-nucleotidase [Pseudalkalibacillus hwajinpoensis]|uniref:bifunctional metallophosphatase/5'-nucleotidase n=1 Tax=Guptibacillus hwajinpoensis TaxID=208199 RepID=UPI00325AC391
MTSKTLHFYYTNDLHSHFENWAKVSSYLKEKKRWHDLNGTSCLLLDLGDHSDKVHPITEGTVGKGNVKLLNDLEFDYATIGNNEGITFSKQELEALYTEATFQVIVANLYHQDGTRPSWAIPYTIHELDGVKVGIIGITIPYEQFYSLLGWSIQAPLTMLQELVNDVSNQADVVMLMSHMGLGNDEQIAREINGIDVIIGAHTHHVLKHGMMVKDTLITQAGKNGNYVGEVTLCYDSESKEVTEKEAYAVSIRHRKEDQETKDIIDQLSTNAQSLLEEVVCRLEQPLEAEWFKRSVLPDELAAALREWCDADIGMINSGMLLDGLAEGNVSREDLHRICPHPVNPCKVILKGTELKEIISHSMSDELVNLSFKGLGFRGEVMGIMAFDGLEVKTVMMEDGLHHVTDVLHNGNHLSSDKEYAVATADMFTFGKFYPQMKHAKKKYYLPEMLRDLLAYRLENRY